MNKVRDSRGRTTRPRTKPSLTGRTPAIEETIVEALSLGKGLKGIASQIGIPRRTLRSWEESDSAWAGRCRLARRLGYEFWAEEILTIGAEAALPGKTMPEVAAARLEVDSRKWLLSKLHPEQYGDRVELTGADGRDLIPVDVRHQAIPRLLQILAVLLPAADNNELFTLATTMARKLKALDDPDTSHPKVLTNGAVDQDD